MAPPKRKLSEDVGGKSAPRSARKAPRRSSQAEAPSVSGTPPSSRKRRASERGGAEEGEVRRSPRRVRPQDAAGVTSSTVGRSPRRARASQGGPPSTPSSPVSASRLSRRASPYRSSSAASPLRRQALEAAAGSAPAGDISPIAEENEELSESQRRPSASMTPMRIREAIQPPTTQVETRHRPSREASSPVESALQSADPSVAAAAAVFIAPPPGSGGLQVRRRSSKAAAIAAAERVVVEMPSLDALSTCVRWAKGLALIFILWLTAISLFGLIWNLYIRMFFMNGKAATGNATSYARYFWKDPEVMKLVQDVRGYSKTLRKLMDEESKFFSKVDALKSDLNAWKDTLSILEEQTDSLVASDAAENSLGLDMAQTLLNDVRHIGAKSRSDLGVTQAVVSEVLGWATSSVTRAVMAIEEEEEQKESFADAAASVAEIASLAQGNKEASLELGQELESMWESAPGSVTKESLVDWLERTFAAHRVAVAEHLEAKRKALRDTVRLTIVQELEDLSTELFAPLSREEFLTFDEMELALERRLEAAAAGGVGSPDFAAHRIGGTVVHDPLLTTPDYARAQLAPLEWVYNKLRIASGGGAHLEPAETVISGSGARSDLGHCWSFQGSTGRLTVKLASPIFPGAITLVHVPEASAPNGARSALDSFWVDGWAEHPLIPGSESTPLIHPTSFNVSSSPVQSFPVLSTLSQAVQYVTVHVGSNHGSSYTCLYGVRVHPAYPKN